MIWDLETGRRLQTIEMPDRFVPLFRHGAIYAEDQRALVAIDNTLTVWDLGEPACCTCSRATLRMSGTR